ncbi:Ca-activated chloride channel family protein [Lacibacter cauensis]|uniref:Ca-activated chloride channel family protein n=1 Tax=Lacibacter cauensis TaxID=510947 RepID=A0A562SQE6_9BACT|nr:tetratricopeptide repeat protein [Lacibacter cauensis]TWI83475.1 Ca-activated chloride channel family protein [Lacibacter cauensis]
MKLIITILISFLCVYAYAQDGDVVKGNRYYKEGNYEKAEESYRKALEKKPTPVAGYNLGNTLYKREEIDKAIKAFDEAIAAADDPALKIKALYNKAVLLHKNNRLPEAIAAYKQALRLSPDDDEVRKNLQIALRAQKQQQPEEKKKNQKQQQQPKEEKKKEQPKPQQPKPQKSKLTKKQAEQYLKALEQKEKELQEKVQKKTGAPNQPEKDW